MDWFAADGYWLSRLVFQRGLALVYLVAFLTALNQYRALIGEHGLLPAPIHLRETPFRQAPSIFHLHYSDRFFTAAGWVGVVASGVLLIGLADGVPLWAHMAIWAIPWALYVSIVNVGQTWYAFGWELLLCEVGFLAIFLGPADVEPPLLVVLALVWVLFRLEFGAGLIKMRGDSCWRDLTCLYYHHETQPMPNPLSWYFHHLPKPMHRIEVAANHVTQLAVPFLLFAPQPIRGVAATVVIATQLWLVLSGNFAWLNALAIVIATVAVGDSIVGAVLQVSPPDGLTPSPGWHRALVIAVAVLVAGLSYGPVRNLAGRRQLMNYSFTPLHLVNTYGAFGNITRMRHEIIIEGTDAVDPADPDATWREYQFNGKPGDVRRRPPQVAPYHLRLDWLMWFAAVSRSYATPWFSKLLARLLDNDRAAVRLLRTNPFPDAPPVWVRARLYRYRFTSRAERRATGAWWTRSLVRTYHRPVRAGQPDGDADRAQGHAG